MQARPPTVRFHRRSHRSWLRSLRYYYYRLIRMEGSAEAIARGFAAGVFSGMFPLFGLQTAIGIAIAILVRGNKIMAAAGTWVSNPITDLPIFLLNFKVGQWLLGANHLTLNFAILRNFEALAAIGSELLIIWFTGCLVVGCISAIASYFLSLRLIRRWRLQQLRRRANVDRRLVAGKG